MTTTFNASDVHQHFVLAGVSWSYYEQTLKEIGNQPIRVAFLDGVMELISPLPQHEGAAGAIGDLVKALAEEHQIPRQAFRSTTFRRESKAAGAEPDECFYFHEISSVQGMKRFDPRVHRPPDLWIEVDLLNPSVPREPIFTRLGVPEIWRYDRDHLIIRLQTPSGAYTDSSVSAVFPFLPMAAFAEFIPKMIEGDQTRVLREFREWVRNLKQ